MRIYGTRGFFECYGVSVLSYSAEYTSLSSRRRRRRDYSIVSTVKIKTTHHLASITRRRCARDTRDSAAVASSSAAVVQSLRFSVPSSSFCVCTCVVVAPSLVSFLSLTLCFRINRARASFSFCRSNRRRLLIFFCYRYKKKHRVRPPVIKNENPQYYYYFPNDNNNRLHRFGRLNYIIVGISRRHVKNSDAGSPSIHGFLLMVSSAFTW